MIKVAKFGGSSVASAEQFKKVKSIIEADNKRRVVVVSALGKRFSSDSKITDMLYLLSYHVRYNVDSTVILNQIIERYEEVKKELDIHLDLSREFEIIKENIKKGYSEDYIVSRGEYLCAKLMASYLGYDFVDAEDVIFFKYDGTIDNEKTIEAIKSRFTVSKRMVVPGFYGVFPTGEIKLFSRGGSDITGSILAMALNVDKYENWTDVSGLLMADTRIVENPKPICEITYDELRELSYMGASVLHEETIFPVRELNIPIHILNTNRPNDEGTIICRKSSKNDYVITGVSGKKGYTAFTVVKAMSANKLAV
ncbi:MAG: aspartate kinase, partial [Clostridia bacterium]|nr:aspartate kinase [Clostridia bacterium]